MPAPPRDDPAAELFRRCCLLLRNGDPAAQELLPALERHGGFAPGWAELGRTLVDLGKPEAARVAFERAVAIRPGFAEAWFALGLTRQDLRDHTGAAAAYRAALQARPDLHEAALNLGIACQDAGDLAAALDAYARALRLRPDAFGRIAQALTSGPTGALWLDLAALRRELAARA